MTGRARTALASTAALWIVAVVAVLFFMRAAKSLLIPIALAVLISYALEPVVAWLERHRVHRIAGAGLVLLLVLGLTASGVYALRDDAMQLVETLPKAAERGREMVLSQLGSGAEAIQEAAKGIGSSSGAEGGGSAAEQPIGTSGQTTGSLVQRAGAAIFATGP